FHQRRPRFARAWVASFPAASWPSRPRPPVLAIGLPIKNALAGDRDVLLFKGIDERRVIHQLHAFPTRENDGQIFLRIGIEFDRAVLLDVQVDVALEMNRAG